MGNDSRRGVFVCEKCGRKFTWMPALRKHATACKGKVKAKKRRPRKTSNGVVRLTEKLSGLERRVEKLIKAINQL